MYVFIYNLEDQSKSVVNFKHKGGSNKASEILEEDKAWTICSLISPQFQQSNLGEERREGKPNATKQRI